MVILRSGHGKRRELPTWSTYMREYSNARGNQSRLGERR